jgi:hypothetical protein
MRGQDQKEEDVVGRQADDKMPRQRSSSRLSALGETIGTRLLRRQHHSDDEVEKGDVDDA